MYMYNVYTHVKKDELHVHVQGTCMQRIINNTVYDTMDELHVRAIKTKQVTCTYIVSS